jgi:predicted transcriptional regulator
MDGEELDKVIENLYMGKLANQDLQAILRRLQDGPKTAKDISTALRLTVARVNSLLQHLASQGAVYSPRCVPGTRPYTSINLWELTSQGAPHAEQGRAS